MYRNSIESSFPKYIDLMDLTAKQLQIASLIDREVNQILENGKYKDDEARDTAILEKFPNRLSVKVR